jgi:hypothetical protein
MHLTAACLFGAKVEFDPQPFQKLNYGPASFGKKRVVIAGDK